MIPMIQRSSIKAWTPARVRPLPSPFGTSKAKLGQGDTFFTYPQTVVATDFLITAGSGLMWWIYSGTGSRWATFWAVVTAVSGVKMLHDTAKW